MINLEVTFGDEGLEPLHKVLYLELLTGPLETRATGDLLRRDENIADNLDYTILSDAILNRDTAEAVDFDRNETSVASDVDTKVAVLEQGREIDVEVSLRHTLLGLALSGVVGIGVQGVVGNKVVLEKSLQVLLAVLAEEEGVDPRTKLRESEVGRCEEGATLVIGSVNEVEEACLPKTKLEGRKFAGKQADNRGHIWGREDNGVDAVNNTVGAEDVNCDNARVEVDSQSLQSKFECNALRLGLASEVVTLEESRSSVAEEHTLGWVEVLDDVVRKQSLEELLARLVVVLRDLLEGLIGRGEDGLSKG